MSQRPPVALSIAGSDSGGGAGIAADLKTFGAHGVWGAVAITAVTAQNTLGVQAVETVTPELVRAQIASVVSDLEVRAAKTGMLGSAENVEIVAEAVRLFGVGPLVVDPVLESGTGDRLLEEEALEVVVEMLLPVATVVTPNLAEAAALLGDGPIADRAGMEAAARRLADIGPEVVMVTGGHLEGGDSPDCVVAAGGGVVWLEAGRIASDGTHGSGCVLAAAICAELARGMEPIDACVAGKHFVEKAIVAGRTMGAGAACVDPSWAMTF